MSRHIEHRLLAPDGRPLIVIAKERVRSGETIRAFLRRNDWRFDLPTRCFINGQVIRPSQLTKIRIRVRDEIVIVSRPGLGGGRSGSPSTAKTIGSIVAMVALAVLAPWAGGAIAGAVGLAGATIAGVAYSSIFSGFILAAGGMLLSQFFKPKAAKANSASQSPLYSITASGNQAKPLGMIPVGYGQRLRYPEYAAPPYTTYSGDDQYLYQLFCIGCGDYDPVKFLIDDTVFWTLQDGTNTAFQDVQLQWVRPGEQVTLFPVNITSASEVSGQQFPSPSRDPVRNGWLGPFSINPPDTSVREIWLDFVWPSGAGATRQGRDYAVDVPMWAEGRPIDGAGAPIGGEGAPWVVLLNKTYSINSTRAYRVTEKIPVAPGSRWQVRAKRMSDALSGQTIANGAVQAHDDVSWTAVRALIDGPQAFKGVTMLATVMKADAQLSAGAQNRIGVIACRRLEVFQGGTWTTIPSRNPVDAAIDIWRNKDYAAGLPATNLVLQDLLLQRDAATVRGDTFDHFFEDAISIQDALESALRVVKANPSFIGDRLGIVRDEPKAVRMFFTDQEIVRGSLTVKRQLLDDTWADGVVVTYFDERTNRSASAASGKDLVRPARVEVPGVSIASKAVELASHLAAVNRYRRRRVSFQIELEGRMLKRGDLILVQSELPQTWGVGGEVSTFLIVNGVYQLTLSVPVAFAAGQQHYIMLRRRNGRPYGPVKVDYAAAPTRVVSLNAADLAAVEQQQGPITLQVLVRRTTEDPPSFSFSQGSPREYRGLVVSATQRDSIATLETVIEAPEVYAVIPGEVPAVPGVPAIFTDATLPVISRLSARAFQRNAQLIVSVSWDAVRNAALYLAQLSIDNGTSWVEAYRDAYTSFERSIPGTQRVKVRVACITASGVLCRFVQTECEVPDLIFDSDWIPGFEEVERAISEVAAIGEAELRRGLAILLDVTRDLNTRLEEMANAAATEAGQSYQQRQFNKVAAEGRAQDNFSAIQRVDEARISDAEAFSGITTTLGSRLTTAEGSIVGQAVALQSVTTRVTNAEGVVTAQGQAITNLTSRVDNAELNISGQATATQQLTTRVVQTEFGIQSLTSQYTALQSRVTDAEGVNTSQATAIQGLNTAASNLDGRVTASATQIGVLNTVVGGHSATLTQYGASIDGVKVQYGVTGSIDGQTGGFVLEGVRRNDGQVSYTLYIKADIIADGAITARTLAAQQLILNGQIFDGAVSTMIGAESASPSATVTFTNTRAGGTQLFILGIFNPAALLTMTAAQAGNFEIYINGARYRTKVANVSPGNNGVYVIGDAISKQIGVGSGTFNIQVIHTNAFGAGQSSVIVIELNK